MPAASLFAAERELHAGGRYGQGRNSSRRRLIREAQLWKVDHGRDRRCGGRCHCPDTKVVRVGSESDIRQQAFSPDVYGVDTFPRIRDFVAQKAVEASEIGALALSDKTKLAETYGTASSTGSIIPVKFEGVVGEGKSGLYNVTIDGVPSEIRVRVQTGPAINGTDLRDVPGISPSAISRTRSVSKRRFRHQPGNEAGGA